MGQTLSGVLGAARWLEETFGDPPGGHGGGGRGAPHALDCDACGTAIRGNRLSCADCGTDLCGGCYIDARTDGGHDPYHTWEWFKTPAALGVPQTRWADREDPLHLEDCAECGGNIVGRCVVCRDCPELYLCWRCYRHGAHETRRAGEHTLFSRAAPGGPARRLPRRR